MLFFSIGTVPAMLGLGSLIAVLGRRFRQRVLLVGSILVVVLGMAMFAQGGTLIGLQPASLAPAAVVGAGTDIGAGSAILSADGTQEVISTLEPGRYPNIIVASGTPVRWTIDAPQGSINGCNNRMLIQEYGLEHSFTQGANIIEFTPTTPGVIQYSCWMGMITGTIMVT
jgi:hypothetical protein